jgi:hypothetical protein
MPGRSDLGAPIVGRAYGPRRPDHPTRPQSSEREAPSGPPMWRSRELSSGRSGAERQSF